MQKILSKREKAIFSLTVGVIIFSIIFNFLISPALKKAESLNKEIRVSRLKLKKYVQLLSQKEYIESKYNKVASGLNLLGPDKDTSVTTLSVLETIAKDANILIIDIRPQGNRNIDLYKETVVDLRTEGSIEGYLKFIYNIENSLSLLKIRKFQLSAKPNAPTLEGSFSISQLILD